MRRLAGGFGFWAEDSAGGGLPVKGEGDARQAGGDACAKAARRTRARGGGA